MRKQLLFLSLAIMCGCGRITKPPFVYITKTANNAIKFSGLDLTTIQALATDSASTSAWQSLIPVYKLPADTDLKDYQPIQPGKYTVQDSLVIFTPDTPLQKGQAYFARYYHFAQGNTLWQHIKDQDKVTNLNYTDLVLKQ